MDAEIIDGKQLASAIRARLATRVDRLTQQGSKPRLDAVLVDSGDSAARVYADNQGRTCEELGITYRLHQMKAGSDFDDIAGRLLLLKESPRVHAIMLHMPLPDGVDAPDCQELIAPSKDVEGVNPANIGNIVYGRSSLAPCTALATVTMLESSGVNLKGARCVVVGAGDVVGKPIAVLLMQREATVVSCNIHTWGPAELCRSADVIVAAAGKPNLITADMVKPGATVIDVGVNRVEGPDGKMRTVGDVAFDEVAEVAGKISPVPGGVGPMTVAMLLSNVVDAAARHPRLPENLLENR